MRIEQLTELLVDNVKLHSDVVERTQDGVHAESDVTLLGNLALAPRCSFSADDKL
jgi:hypothetical protein